ncbi:hypothetical protein HDU76_011918 [Blyttiomyces sp. JEL0837]|nr:hypothetical protein HDU76_011918 [Blyttiomyces sp. JEL0837]
MSTNNLKMTLKNADPSMVPDPWQTKTLLGFIYALYLYITFWLAVTFNYRRVVLNHVIHSVAKHLAIHLDNNVKIKHNWAIYNKAVIGSLTSDWVPCTEKSDSSTGLNLFEKTFSENKHTKDADIVIIVMGFNDVRSSLRGGRTISAEGTVQNIISICRKLRSLEKEVWLCPISRWGDTAVLPPQLVNQNARCNEILNEYLENNKDSIQRGPNIDGVNFEFKNKAFYYRDGVHFNKKGYAKFAKDISEDLLNNIIKVEFKSLRKILGY